MKLELQVKRILILLEFSRNRRKDGYCSLGYCYHDGIGTKKDDGKAFQWYLKSVEVENHMAQYFIIKWIRTTKGKEKVLH